MEAKKVTTADVVRLIEAVDRIEQRLQNLEAGNHVPLVRIDDGVRLGSNIVYGVFRVLFLLAAVIGFCIFFFFVVVSIWAYRDAQHQRQEQQAFERYRAEQTD